MAPIRVVVPNMSWLIRPLLKTSHPAQRHHRLPPEDPHARRGDPQSKPPPDALARRKQQPESEEGKPVPFKSQAQRKWMYANKPKMAKRWEKETPKFKKLPERVGRTSSSRPKRRSKGVV